MSTRFFRLYLKLLRGGVAASFIFSLALVSAAEAKVCFLPQAEDCLKDDARPNPDECPTTGYTAYVSKPNCGIGKKAEQSGTVNGKGCYKCVDETSSDCDRGKLDLNCAEGEARKEVGSTNSGLKCYECVDDVCPSPYANTEAEAGCNSVTSYPAEVNGTTKPSGEPCYECKTCSKGEHYESKPSDNCHDYTKVDNEPCWTKTFSSYANSDSSCPTGMQLDPCGEGEKQTATDTSTCGKACYKCEDNQICIKFDLSCDGQKCSSEQISELTANGDDPAPFRIQVNFDDLPITEDTKFCDKPENMLYEKNKDPYIISSSVDGRRISWKFENSHEPYVYKPTDYPSVDGEDNLIFKKADDGYHGVSFWKAEKQCEDKDNDEWVKCTTDWFEDGEGEPLVDNTYTYKIELHKAEKDKRCIYYKVKCYHLPEVKRPNFLGDYYDPTSSARMEKWNQQYEGWSYNDYGNKWAMDCVEIVGNVLSSGDASRVNKKFPLKQMTEAELSSAAGGTDQQEFFQDLADDEVILKSCDFEEWDTVDLIVSPNTGTGKVTDDAGNNFFWGGYILNNDQCKNRVKGNNNQYSCMSEEIPLFSDHQYETAELYPYVYLTAPVSVDLDEEEPCYESEFVSSWKFVSNGRPLPVDLRLDPTTLGLYTSNSSIFSIYGAFGNDGLVSKGAWEADYVDSAGQTEFRHKRSQIDNKACRVWINPTETNKHNSVRVAAVVVEDNSGNKYDINITEGEPFKANVPNLREDYEGDNYIYLFGKGINP